VTGEYIFRDAKALPKVTSPRELGFMEGRIGSGAKERVQVPKELVLAFLTIDQT
jgi:hypothetical protein